MVSKEYNKLEKRKGSKNMNIFINAYIALYGGTKDNARRVWRATDKEYHDLIIVAFKQNAHKAFYNDLRGLCYA